MTAVAMGGNGALGTKYSIMDFGICLVNATEECDWRYLDIPDLNVR